jgi:glutaconate CoA-transferase subunit A
VHLNVADARGNAAFLGPDLYFDDLFCQAAERAYLSCERIVSTEELGQVELTRRRIARWMVHGVVEAPGGAHFTSCVPDYDRDERFQKEYVTAAKDPAAWQEFSARYLEVADEAAYQAAVKESA